MHISPTCKAGVTALKSVIREPYAWPGGYERAVFTTDGGVICHTCCKENYRLMLHSTRGDYRDGWQVAGTFASGVDCDAGDNHCDHCNKDF